MIQSLQTGKILRHRYKIGQLLGSGGFGDTYLADDLDLPGHPRCVVKHLKPKNPHPAVLALAKGLFEREAQSLYQLGNGHDQIPGLFAHFDEHGEFYLVQEFVDGHDLSKEISPSQLKSENAVFKLLKDILEILVVVHQHNIIHRDIKPHNLMRRRKDSKIVLIDFGAVKEIGSLGVNAQGQTSVTVAVGTAGYMPSEQANGRPKLCSDVYAVGMLGIQALTGLMPHELPKDPYTGEVIWRDKAQVSDSLANVLDTMVRDHFSQRYQSAAVALQALITTVVSPPPPSPSPIPSTVVSPPTQPSPSPVSSPVGPSARSKPLLGTFIGFVIAVTTVALLNRPSPTPTPQTSFVPPHYIRLSKLLAAGNWKEANIETLNMTKESDSFRNCDNIRTIDQLWIKFSNGRFGFSVQKRLWESEGGEPMGYRPSTINADTYSKYAKRVGWLVNNSWLSDEELTYATNAPQGHLPFRLPSSLSSRYVKAEYGKPILRQAYVCQL